MNKFIVTTTIQAPTLATNSFSGMKDWQLIIVGDLKTPHDAYKEKGNWIYLDPDYQQRTYPKLSDTIGWNCIMRRNIGFVEAYKRGADIVASIDDDNIPYTGWGENLLVGNTIEVDIYNCDAGVLDPMQLTNHKELWHRGYPVDRVYESKKIRYCGKSAREVLFQVGLWDGDPDVDALCRLMYKPTDLTLTIDAPFSTDNFVPFNSQNTFIHRSALPYYMVLPHVGRSDDIWGGYMAEKILHTRPIFTKASTNQIRNEQQIYKNLDDELLGYRNTSKLLDNFIQNTKNRYHPIPKETINSYLLYIEEFA